MFPISWQRLKEGAKLCRDNAIRLTDCSLKIFEKYPLIASYLIILAMEEIGKGIALAKNYEKGIDLTEKEWKKLSKGKDAHKRKLKIVHTALIDPYSFLKPHELSVRSENIKEFQHRTSRLADDVHELKLDYFYVDWNDKENRWRSPIKPLASIEAVRQEWQLISQAIHLLTKKLREKT